MTPIEAIQSTDKMHSTLNRLRSAFANETDEIVELWDGLGRVGGQRDDHAASFLGRLRPHLQTIASFCTACDEQIAEMESDPFGRH